MKEYDICFECGKVTKIHKDTLKAMRKLNLKASDYKIRCQACKDLDYYNILKQFNNRGNNAY